MTHLLLLVAALATVMAAAGVGAGAEWDVYPGAGTPIQDAINASYPGDTIYVHAGLYYENLNVGKRLTLKGDGADVVTVRAGDAGGHVFKVTADWVNISGFTVTGATGIRLDRVDYCSIYDNSASNSDDGIYLYSSNNNTLTDNIVNSNNDNGINLYSSSGNTLQSNTASNNNRGIWLWYSSNNMLQSNTMSENTGNFGVSGDSLSHYIQNIDTSNTVDGKPIYYWVDQEDKQIPDDAGFVGVVNSTNITVKDLILILLCQISRHQTSESEQQFQNKRNIICKKYSLHGNSLLS